MLARKRITRRTLFSMMAAALAGAKAAKAKAEVAMRYRATIFGEGWSGVGLGGTAYRQGDLYAEIIKGPPDLGRHFVVTQYTDVITEPKPGYADLVRYHAKQLGPLWGQDEKSE